MYAAFSGRTLSLPKHAILLFFTDTAVVSECRQHQLGEIDSGCPFLSQYTEVQQVLLVEKARSISATSKHSSYISHQHKLRSAPLTRDVASIPFETINSRRQIQGRHAARGRGRVRSEGACAREEIDGRHIGGRADSRDEHVSTEHICVGRYL